LIVPSGRWERREEVDSTQDVAAELLRSDSPAGIVLARHQRAGRGRFARVWHSDPGDSLTASLVFESYADHPRPYLLGMAVAIAAAGALHCELRWPNDLVHGSRKLGGILTELRPDPQGRQIPVVGLGVNLNQRKFPEEIVHRAISLWQIGAKESDPEDLLRRVLSRLSDLPEPSEWSALETLWRLFDATPGKSYTLPDGSLAHAIGVGSEGQLLCTVEGDTRSVFAADALL
jgi:BirA family biotin operon repressor/biotin-[acetyl-CoA-carboxylase] ligase